MIVDYAFAGAGLAAWLFLLTARGGFWRTGIRNERNLAPEPREWPSIAVVIPARNEASVIAASITSLLTQDYPKPLSVILTDDQSEDGTAEIARAAAEAPGASDRLTVIAGVPLPPAGPASYGRKSRVLRRPNRCRKRRAICC